VYFKSFSDHLSETCNCWKGYKRKPGTAPCAEGSCIKEGKRGLWDNIHAKQKRIKAGSGERMRKPGSEGAPTAAALKASQVDESSMTHYVKVNNALKTTPSGVHVMKFPDKASAQRHADEHKRRNPNHHVAVTTNANNSTPVWHGGTKTREYSMREKIEAQFDLIEELVMDLASQHNIDPEVIWEKFETIDDVELYEAAVDAKGHKSSTGGLTQKGRDAYNAKGANLQAPVTTPPSKLKAGSKAANRRKSFCARMGGMEGPMKKPNGEPSRKALALRKWNC
jgi:hypothetical protein